MLQLPRILPGLQAGRDDDASFLNFQSWLKQIVLSQFRDSVVKLGNVTEISFLFHKLSQESHSAIESILSHLCPARADSATWS